MVKPRVIYRKIIQSPKAPRRPRHEAGGRSARLPARLPARVPARLPARVVIATAMVLVVGALVGCSAVPSVQNSQAVPVENENPPAAQAQGLEAADTVSSPPTRAATATSRPAQESLATRQSPTSTPRPSNTASPTETLPPVPAVIAAWEMKNFIASTSGCKVAGEDCYHGTDGDKSLSSSDSFYIDPSWPSPKLVFWHTYDLPENTQAYVSIGVNGSWTPINYWKGASLWKQSTIPLQEYSGKTIEVQFYAPFGVLRVVQKCERTGHEGTKNCEDIQKIEKTDWKIQHVEIDPG